MKITRFMPGVGAGLLLVMGGAWAALPFAVTGQGVGGSLTAAMTQANADARAKCSALGRGGPGNLVMVDTALIRLQYHVTVAGNCGGIVP